MFLDNYTQFFMVKFWFSEIYSRVEGFMCHLPLCFLNQPTKLKSRRIKSEQHAHHEHSILILSSCTSSAFAKKYALCGQQINLAKKSLQLPFCSYLKENLIIYFTKKTGLMIHLTSTLQIPFSTFSQTTILLNIQTTCCTSVYLVLPQITKQVQSLWRKTTHWPGQQEEYVAVCLSLAVYVTESHAMIYHFPICGKHASQSSM
jgi:hypothetical protein